MMTTNDEARPVAACATIVAACIAGLITAAIAAPVSAEPPMTRVSESIGYGDLDLSTASGARALYMRLEAATDRVCAQPTDGVFPRAAAAVWKCSQDTLARSIAQVHSPQLRAEYATHTKVPLPQSGDVDLAFASAAGRIDVSPAAP